MTNLDDPTPTCACASSVHVFGRHGQKPGIASQYVKGTTVYPFGITST